eukprot:gnl/MRDRNA2_/MRDRNA2_90826_c0_seq1.p1 gnl/MRDRNA2_/MRDRNA2_90826_c0~~gnl/MRDRNA2_/MRDRNA2_90826_c0_seq1.p1  ORF type:complete len:622 (+),score=146.99 gnl/MRDRNA2_/MRDRNA2_90826_c0_seq1:194-1867(+)
MYPHASDEMLEEAALTGDLNDALDVVCAQLEEDNGTHSKLAPPPPPPALNRSLSGGDRDTVELVRALSGGDAVCTSESDSITDAALARMMSLLPAYTRKDLKALLDICGNENEAVDVVLDAPWLVEPMVSNQWSRAYAEKKRMEEHDELDKKAKKAADQQLAQKESVPAKPSDSKVRRTKDGWEIRCVVDTSRPCQSLRSNIKDPAERIMKEVGDDNTAAFAAICFEQMLQREQELEGKFCVFYHAYNGAALMYEVQAEIARCAFGLDDSFAPLPRIFHNQFTDVTVGKLRSMLADRRTSDHDTRFRACAISATPSLFGYGSEAPPLQCFRMGYGCGDVSFRALLVGIVHEGCGVTEAKAKSVVDEICQVGAKYGLQTSMYRDSSKHGFYSAPAALGGQMLQIFVSLEEVEDLVYRSHAYGYPHEDQKRISEWLYPSSPVDRVDPVDGQVRIMCRPDALVDSSRARIYHYCANWEFFGGRAEDAGSRAAFVQDLRKILGPVMKAEDVKKRVTAPGSSTISKAVPKKSAPPPVKSVPSSGSGGYPAGGDAKKKGKKKK